MFSRIVSIPFILAALILLYLTWEVDQKFAPWIAIPVIIGAVIYVFSPQINWWWYHKHPPKLDPMVESLFNRYFKFYQNLTPLDKKKFRDRVSLYMMGHEYIPQGMPSVQTDVQGLIAACPVWLTFGKDDFLLPKFERIVVYPHPFPSPEYPEILHASETHVDDGVIIFSIEQFMLGFIQTEKFYHLGMHEYAKAYIASYPYEDYPPLDDRFWELMPQISGLRKEAIEGWIGLTGLEPLPVAIVHFFTHAEQFRLVLPDLYERFRRIFHMDPASRKSAFSLN